MVKRNLMRQAKRLPSFRGFRLSIYIVKLFATTLICNLALAQANQQIVSPPPGTPTTPIATPAPVAAPVAPAPVPSAPNVNTTTPVPTDAASKAAAQPASSTANPTPTQAEPASASGPVAAAPSAVIPPQTTPQPVPTPVPPPPPAPPPLPADWYAEWKSSAKSERQKIITKIAVTKLNQEKYEIVPVAKNASLPSSFLQTPDDTEIALSSAINKIEGGNGCDKSIIAVANCLDAQYVLDITGDNWLMYYVETKPEKATQVLKAPKDGGDAYFTWLKSQINYDTIVMAQKGNYILALLPPAMTTPGIRGKLFANSSKDHALNKNTALAIGQVQLLKSQGRLGVFTLVSTGLYDKLTIPPFSKILLDPVAAPGGANP